MTDRDLLEKLKTVLVSGYRIVRDPYFAVYTSSTGETGGPSGISTIMIIVAAGAAALIALAVVVMKRRK